MPEISFCFQGWIRGVNVQQAFTPDGEKVDTQNMSSDELVEQLKNGELLLSFADCVGEGSEEEIELHDYETY